jgi:GNAT superfamily N-acetyltransferase
VDLRTEPVTPARWDDLVTVFGERGVPSRCWCAYLRQPRADYRAGPANREALHRVVDAGHEPGLLAYAADEPVGWVSVGPRADFLPRLERSRSLRPLPGDGFWSVLCFVVPPRHRRQGVAAALLAGAVGFARERGARAVEGYPLDDSGGRRWSSADAFVGVASMFVRAGFTVVEPRGTHVACRLDL